MILELPIRAASSRWPVVLGALSLLLGSGCSNTYEGNALTSVYHNRTDQLVAKYGLNAKSPDPALQADLFTASSSQERNEKIDDFIFLIDRNYDSWEKRLYDKKAFTDFFSSSAVIGLNAAGAITGGTDVKAILSAISGGIEGTKAGFDRDVLQNQNLLALMSEMRALRSQRLKTILLGMQEGIDQYSMQAALVDLGEYYNAGTITAALQDITAKAGARKTTDDAENQKLKTFKGKYSYTDDSTALRNYWKPQGVVNADHAAAFNAWLKVNEQGVDIATFLYSSQFVADRHKAVVALTRGTAEVKPRANPVKPPAAPLPARTNAQTDGAHPAAGDPPSEDLEAALRVYWKPGGLVDPAHAAKFQAWLAEHEGGVDIATFIDSSKFTSEHQKAVSALIP